MSTVPTPVPVQVPADGGETVFLVGDTYTTILRGDQTGGLFCLCEATLPAGAGPPPHIHHDAEETFYLLEGELTFRVGETSYDAAPGTTVPPPPATRRTRSRTAAPRPGCSSCTRPPGWTACSPRSAPPGVRGAVAPAPPISDIGQMIAVAEKYKYSLLVP